MRNAKSFDLRVIAENDIDTVLALYRQCEDFLALGPDPKASAEMVRKDLEISRREGGVYYGIYDANGQMIGVVDFVSCGFEGKRQVAFLSLLMIASCHRRHGIGAAIVQQVEGEIFRDVQVMEIRLGVQVNNPEALRFWQRNGYRIVGGPEWMPDQTTVYHLCKDRL